MTILNFKTLDGSPVRIPRQQLQDAVAAPIVSVESSDYDASRAVWNAMIDRRPGAVVRARSEEDVAAAVAFAARHRLALAVRSGGHNIAGTAVRDDALVIDLRAMNRVEVDAAGRTARVGPGATLADVDRATQAHGLVVPTGINSTTGIAGLTLGGGFGWTSRKLGLTVDSLRSARLVTADGRVCMASADENPDLFWALRGGGGNFGVVTRFEFDLHPLGPDVYAGLSVHPLAAAGDVIPAYQGAVAQAPDDLTCWAVLRQAPPLPFLPEAWHGREVLILAMCYVGKVGEGEEATRVFRELGTPVAEAVGPMPFAEWQMAFDPLLTEGARNYWKSHDVAEFDSEAVSLITSAVAALPTAECEVFFGHIGGQATRPAPGDTPWPNRAAHFAVNVHTRWRDPADDGRCVAWARDLYDALTPHAQGSRYVNFVPDGDEGGAEAIYGANYRRLAAIKCRWDPNNLFRANVNVAGHPN